MSNRNKLTDWLSIEWPLKFAASPRVGAFLGVLLTGIFILLVIGSVGTLVEFLAAILHLGAYDGEVRVDEAIRNIGLVLAAIIGAPFIAWRSFTAHKQAQIAEQGHITEQINKAVEGLGTEKTVYDDDGKARTVPNMEVRLGAIYALERIGQDSPRDHLQIMEILCAYVRENSSATDMTPNEPPFPRPKPRNDIQAVISVLGRRGRDRIGLEHEVEFRLDLRDCDLSGVDFQHGDFSAAMLHGCRLEAAKFDRAKLHGTQFYRSLLNFASFFKAELHGTRMEGVIINLPIPTAGGFTQSINMGDIYGLSLGGADLGALDYIGESDRMNLTMGTKDTKLHSGMESGRRELKNLQVAVRRAKSKNQDNLDELEAALNSTGFANWCTFDLDDLAYGHFRGEFLRKLELDKWPYL